MRGSERTSKLEEQGLGVLSAMFRMTKLLICTIKRSMRRSYLGIAGECQALNSGDRFGRRYGTNVECRLTAIRDAGGWLGQLFRLDGFKAQQFHRPRRCWFYPCPPFAEGAGVPTQQGCCFAGG